MMSNPVMAEWETQVRVKSNQQLAERLRLERLAESPGRLSHGSQASLSPAERLGSGAAELARPSTLAKSAWNRIQSLFLHPPMAGGECA
jgi:hypothetical protein